MGGGRASIHTPHWDVCLLTGLQTTSHRVSNISTLLYNSHCRLQVAGAGGDTFFLATAAAPVSEKRSF